MCDMTVNEENLEEIILKGSEPLIINKLIMKRLVPVVTGWVDVEPIKSWYTHAHVIAVNVNININDPACNIMWCSSRSWSGVLTTVVKNVTGQEKGVRNN